MAKKLDRPNLVTIGDKMQSLSREMKGVNGVRAGLIEPLIVDGKLLELMQALVHRFGVNQVMIAHGTAIYEAGRNDA